MHKYIDQIKKAESSPKVIRNIFNKKEIDKFYNLYNQLPTTVHNKKQNVIKKRWLIDYSKDLEALFSENLKMKLVNLKWII